MKLLPLLLILFFSTAKANDLGEMIRFPVVKYQLKNGLTVLLHEDHSVPTVSYHTWFRVGSKDEEVGYTGMAHLFEHMMFKGAKRYPGNGFFPLMQANGISSNAFTSFDFTGYYEDLPSSKLELVMDVESDRMVNLNVNAANLKSEKEVVKEERRLRVDNSVRGQLWEAIFSTVFKVHPYRWPVIGWMKDVNRATVEKCEEFYKKFYAPNNAVLVIAGDIDIAKTKKLIDKYYGSLPASTTLSKRVNPSEPEQRGYRFQKIRKDVQSSTFAIVYRVPKAGSDEAYALDLLSNILGKGSSSRLYRSLVYKKQVATSASAFNYSAMEEGIFQMTVGLKPGASFEAARKSTLGLIYRLRQRLVTEKELQKAKNQIMKETVDGLKTMNGRAEAMAIYEIYYNNYEKMFTSLAKYSAVTPEQIRDVARKYLDVKKANVILIEPKKRRAASL